MSSQVTICNQSLLRIGSDTINDIDEESAEAEACKMFYDDVRKSVLRAHPWNFATKTVDLGQDETALTGWTYAYTLPADCLRAVKIVPVTTSVDPLQFEIRQRTLVTEQDVPLTLLYVFDQTDEGAFDHRFVEAFSYRLAADLAMALTGNMHMQQQQYSLYQTVLADARGVDAGERRSTNDDIGMDFINARA